MASFVHGPFDKRQTFDSRFLTFRTADQVYGADGGGMDGLELCMTSDADDSTIPSEEAMEKKGEGKRGARTEHEMAAATAAVATATDKAINHSVTAPFASSPPRSPQHCNAPLPLTTLLHTLTHSLNS